MDGVRDRVLDILNSADKPVLLTQMVPQLEDVRATTPSWAGFGRLSILLEDLEIPDLTISGHYVYLEGHHKPPKFSDVAHAGSSDDLTVSEGPLPPLIAWARREIFAGFPNLDQREFAHLFRGISAELAAHAYYITETSKAVRNALAADGIAIGRNAVNFALANIHRGGHEFSAGMPEDPYALSAAFLRGVVANKKPIGYTKKFRQLKDFIQGELVEMDGKPEVIAPIRQGTRSADGGLEEIEQRLADVKGKGKFLNIIDLLDEIQANADLGSRPAKVIDTLVWWRVKSLRRLNRSAEESAVLEGYLALPPRMGWNRSWAAKRLELVRQAST
jgi:hypothetical protein